MKSLLFTLALLLYAATSYAQKQKTETKHPCLLPVLELQNEKKEMLAEGAIPSGKITLRLQKNQDCLEDVKYEVLGMYVALARGSIRKAETTLEGSTIDFTEMESKFVLGDRLVLILKAKYTTDKGKTGEITSSHNWVFKETNE